jgi:hypothetical protein
MTNYPLCDCGEQLSFNKQLEIIFCWDCRFQEDWTEWTEIKREEQSN